MKIAIAVLCVLIGTLAFFAVTDTKIENLMAPNHTWRIQMPPPIAPEEIQREEADLKQVAAEVDKMLPLATIDQRTISGTWTRWAAGTHE